MSQIASPIFDLPQAAALGGSIGAGIVALAYMGGTALNSQSVKAWAKSEFGELIISAVLVAILLALLANLSGAIQALAPPADANFPHFNAPSSGITADIEARLYKAMELPLQGVVDSAARSSMRLTKLLSYNYNYQVGIPIVNPTGTASPAAGGMALQTAIIMGIDSTSLNLLLASSVRVIYVFLSSASVLVLLPLGMLLRFIPPARQVGSLLLAISLSVLIVFPLSALWGIHLLYDPGFSGAIQPINDPPSTSSGFLKTVICSPVLSGVAMVGEDLIGQIIRLFACTGPQAVTPFCADPTPVNPLDPPIPIGPGLHHFVAIYAWLGKFLAGAGNSLALYALSPSSKDVLDAFNSLADNTLPAAVARNVAVLFMVVIDLLCSIVMVKSIAQTLGAENQLYGLSRMV
ncbi:Uncharacterised protein [uncultured archaeon]|nr:Uncharacterised protein [uncultured archaeon]